MWIPKSEEDLAAAAASGALCEGPTFEAKREIGNKSREIAKDICGMTIDGGVIVYGLAEDEHKRPAVLAPFALKGAAERLNMIARTCISEPPRVEAREIRSAADPSQGYIVLVVPQSDRAPHMVTVDGDSRYYRRSDKETVPCSQSDVERLYERRRRWEVDREALLDKVIADAPSPVPELSYLHLFAKPLLDNEDRLSLAARGEANEVVALNKLLERAAEPQVYPGDVGPLFRAARRERHTDDGYLLVLSGNDAAPPNRRNDDLLMLTVTRGLSTTLFYAGLSIELPPMGRTIYASHLAAYTTRYLRFAGDLFAKAGYWGAVDCGIAVTNLKDVTLADLERYYALKYGAGGYTKDTYRRTGRCHVSQLHEEPHAAAEKLIMPLMNAMSQGRENPFSVFKKQEPQP